MNKLIAKHSLLVGFTGLYWSSLYIGGALLISNGIYFYLQNPLLTHIHLFFCFWCILSFNIYVYINLLIFLFILHWLTCISLIVHTQLHHLFKRHNFFFFSNLYFTVLFLTLCFLFHTIGDFLLYIFTQWMRSHNRNSVLQISLHFVYVNVKNVTYITNIVSTFQSKRTVVVKKILLFFYGV